MSSLKDLAIKFADSGRVVIPVEGKRPLLREWSKYCKEIPTVDEVENWRWNLATGIGLPLGKSNNLCCVDIDDATEEEYKLIDANLPKTPFVRKGKKGEARLYRLSNIVHKAVRQVKDGDRVIVEFFYDNKQIVIPPSIHPDTNLPYTWTGLPFSYETDIDDTPVLECGVDSMIEDILMGRQIDVTKMSPSTGRHTAAISYFGSILQKGHHTVDELVAVMLQWDLERNPLNKYFNDRSKCPTSNSYLNALNFVSGNLKAHAMSKRQGEEIDLPITKASIEVNNSIVFPDILEREVTQRVKNEFSEEWVPEVMKKYLDKINYCSGTARESILMTTIASLGSVLGNKFMIQANRADSTWLQAPNIFVLNVNYSGGMKSYASGIATLPLKHIQKLSNEDHKETAKLIQRQKTLTLGKIKSLKSRIDKAISSGEPDDATMALIDDQKQLEDSIEIPPKTQYMSNVSTPEALLDVLQANKYGHLVMENELLSLMTMYNKKGYEMLRKIHMDGWDGTSSISYNTKSNGEKTLDNFALSMVVNSQYSIFENTISDIARKNMDDGLIQRFFLVFPENETRMNYDESKSPGEYPEEMLQVFERAYRSEVSDKKYKFTDEAFETAKAFCDWSVTGDKRPEALVHSFVQKARSNFSRIAFILQFIKNGGIASDIDKECCDVAANMAMYSYRNIDKFYKEKGSNYKKVYDEIEFLCLGGQFIGSKFNMAGLIKSSFNFKDQHKLVKDCVDDMVKQNKLIQKNELNVDKFYVNPKWGAV